MVINVVTVKTMIMWFNINVVKTMINHPQNRNFMGGINHQKLGGLWHCFSHINHGWLIETPSKFPEIRNWLGTQRFCAL